MTETPWTQTTLDRDPPGHGTCGACWDRGPHGQSPPWTETPQTETSLDRDTLDRGPPWTETSLDRDSPGQRFPWTETPLDRD